MRRKRSINRLHRSLTAYLLYMNRVIGEADVIDAKSLPQVTMPNRDNFFPEFPKLMPPEGK